MITLRAESLEWIGGAADDPADPCAHGRVRLEVDGRAFVRPEMDVWTVSAAGLHLLRTLDADHTRADPVTGGSQLFPCCGSSVWLGNDGRRVVCMGCNLGVDLEVRHVGEYVTITDAEGSQARVTNDAWRTAVLGFVEQVQEF